MRLIISVCACGARGLRALSRQIASHTPDRTIVSVGWDRKLFVWKDAGSMLPDHPYDCALPDPRHAGAAALLGAHVALARARRTNVRVR
jgi:hypothetical protein